MVQLQANVGGFQVLGVHVSVNGTRHSAPRQGLAAIAVHETDDAVEMDRLKFGADQLDVEEPLGRLLPHPHDVLLAAELEEFQPRPVAMTIDAIQHRYTNAEFLN